MQDLEYDSHVQLARTGVAHCHLHLDSCQAKCLTCAYIKLLLVGAWHAKQSVRSRQTCLKRIQAVTEVVIVPVACRHAPLSLQYMAKVRDPQNFRFCAIPQVMAIGTLAQCYNNPKVFTGAVSITHSFPL